MAEFMRYPSRRSVVYSTHGMVACTQPLAAQAGIRVLTQGGNAADAAVAVAAVLSLTEPSSTGIGGDCFCLYYDPKAQNITSLNCSGRSPQALTLSHALSTIPLSEITSSHSHIPPSHVHAVTVPGAAAGWCDTVAKYGSGRLSLAHVLAPAIELAEQGVPVSQISAQMWKMSESVLKRGSPGNYSEMLPRGRAPREGEVVRFPGLARTYRILAEKGRKGFYEGEVAEAVVAAVRERGGVMTLEDLKRHGEVGSEVVRPISIEIPWGSDETGEKKRVWECAPNGQGLVALQALGVLSALQERGVIPEIGGVNGYKHNSVEYLHALITSLRLSFSDAAHFIHDPHTPPPIPLRTLLSKFYLHTRSHLFSPTSPPPSIPHGHPENSCDTVYFCVADVQGGACSFINSLFTGFGSGIIPRGYGFPLQNRGAGFVLAEGHGNVLDGGKRPYHTIIPGMVTTPLSGVGRAGRTGGDWDGQQGKHRLDTIFGVMGGYMQPQGHVQVLLNLLAFRMSPQAALDAPRICLGPNYSGSANGEQLGVLVNVEVGIGEDVVEALRALGYIVAVLGGEEGGEGRGAFGRGQVVRNGWGVREEVGGREGEERGRVGVGYRWSGGSDMRGDGACVGY